MRETTRWKVNGTPCRGCGGDGGAGSGGGGGGVVGDGSGVAELLLSCGGDKGWGGGAWS